jgi:hypothetical protein
VEGSFHVEPGKIRKDILGEVIAMAEENVHQGPWPDY